MCLNAEHTRAVLAHGIHGSAERTRDERPHHAPTDALRPLGRADHGDGLGAEQRVERMPFGLPQRGDGGLDGTRSWGRTYWGGALFCLLADVEIHRRTHNRMGLREALRGVLAAGGNIQVDWPVARVLTAADKAVGVPVLSGLYARLGSTAGPQSAELEQLWKDLGVVADGDGVRLVDDAPLAAVRKAITAPSP